MYACISLGYFYSSFQELLKGCIRILLMCLRDDQPPNVTVMGVFNRATREPILPTNTVPALALADNNRQPSDNNNVWVLL